MPDVLIVGGSLAGLTCGMLLARAGRQVTVLEHDPAATPPDMAAAASWERPTVPQTQHAHTFHALARSVLIRRLPDVLGELRAHGATEFPLQHWNPAAAATVDPARTADLVSLGCRRTTLEWVLRRRAMVEPGLTLRSGVTVTGLSHRPGPIPRVIGVQTRKHGTLRAEVVIDASGRRAPLAQAVAEIGASHQRWDEECGFIAYTRFYRLHHPAAMPRMPLGGNTIVTLDGCGGYAFLTDNDTLSVVLGRLPQDRALAPLRHPTVFDQAVAAIPPLAPWIHPIHATPISPVAVMAGLRATIRFPLHQGRPRLLGLHTIGDAFATVSPFLGRGASLAIAEAELVADGLAAEPDSPRAAAELIGRRLTELALPWWRDTVRHDRARVTHWQTTLDLPVTAPPPPTEVPLPLAFAAAAADPDIWIRVTRAIQMLDLPQGVFDDAELAARIHALSPPPLSPPARRTDLLDAINPHQAYPGDRYPKVARLASA